MNNILALGERIFFDYLTSMKYIGDSCALEILRKGEVPNHTVY